MRTPALDLRNKISRWLFKFISKNDNLVSFASLIFNANKQVQSNLEKNCTLSLKKEVRISTWQLNVVQIFNITPPPLKLKLVIDTLVPGGVPRHTRVLGVPPVVKFLCSTGLFSQKGFRETLKVEKPSNKNRICLRLMHFCMCGRGSF